MKYDSDKNGFITINEMMSAVSILSEDKVTRSQTSFVIKEQFVARKKKRKSLFHNWMWITMGRYGSHE